jgi:uncharacterized phage protein (TIGR02220 family)
MAQRVNLSFSDEEMIRLLKWNQTGLPLTTAVKWLVVDALHILSGEFVTTPIGSNTVSSGSGKFPSGVTTPTPSPARARKKSSLKTPDPEKKKTKRGSVRGGQATLIGTDPEPISEPFVQEVVGHLNDVCGTEFPLFDRQVRELVAKLLAANYTIEDIKIVNTWAHKRWPPPNPGDTDWRATFLVPSKLYGEKFGEHLGVAKGQLKGGGAQGRGTNSAGIPLDQMIGSPEYNARMGYTDKDPESK